MTSKPYNIAYQFSKDSKKITIYSCTDINEVPWLFNKFASNVKVPSYFIEEFSLPVPNMGLYSCTTDLLGKPNITIKNTIYNTVDSVRFLNIIILKEIMSMLSEIEILEIGRAISNTPVYKVNGVEISDS